MNCLDLYQCIQSSETALGIINKYDDPSKRGNIYEKLWDMVVKLGFCPQFPSDEYVHFRGNINDNSLKAVDNLIQYFKSTLVFSKNNGGSSDITLFKKSGALWVFISSKYHKDDSSKFVKAYDVQDIVAAINSNSHTYQNYEINLLVNNKSKVKKKINDVTSSTKHLTNYVTRIMDINDLERCYQRLHDTIKGVPLKDINAYFGGTKIPLILRFHQRMHIHQTMARMTEGDKVFLWGWKCRSGKSFGVAGLLQAFQQSRGKCNALIVTPIPSETVKQFTDELFHKFRELSIFNVFEIRTSKQISDIPSLVGNNVIVTSKQLLDEHVGNSAIRQLCGLDFLIFDENHFHGTTDKSVVMIETYTDVNTNVLYLTATFAKPLLKWNIPKNCQFYWNIEDEQMCKRRDIEGLMNVHGEHVKNLVNDSNKDDVLSFYDLMPEMHIITTMMDDFRYGLIKDAIKDTSYGFSVETLFSLNTHSGEFNYPNEVCTLLRFISGSKKERDFGKKDRSIFNRIKTIALNAGSRTTLDNQSFTTQLWFLPIGRDLYIDKVSCSLKKHMLNDSILKDFEVLIINSKKEYKVKDLKQTICNMERKARHEGKRGLILLAGNQCTLGITLPLVDVVFLLNNSLSADKVFQMMYRCMSESPDGNKKCGIVVDLNISRVLNIMVEFPLKNKDLTIEGKFKYLIENNLINIDSDMFVSKQNKAYLVEKILMHWKSDPINNLKQLLQGIENDIITLDTDDQQKMNQHFSKACKSTINVRVEFDEESQQKLPRGRNMEEDIQGGPNKKDAKKDIDKDTDQKPLRDEEISLSKDVIPFLLPLSCILTVKDKVYNFLDMLQTIKHDNTLLEIFNSQSLVWWQREDVIELLSYIVKKYIGQNSNIYKVAINFKMSLQSLIDRPKELLELIDSCLKPKDKEKQQNGEVFTPMNIVNETLDRVDEHYLLTNGKSIFTEAHLKWFDPANGMGNFPVAVYLRLNEGLKCKMPDDKERKKHILENMLYMSEVNKKNVYIAKQIFDINNEYRMNIYEGDTLHLDCQKVWGVAKFDIIIGNPPYNQGGIRSHTGKKLGEQNKTLWPEFVTKSLGLLEHGGYLVFITPLSWLKKTHSVHIAMLTKHVVWLKLWDNIKSLATINGKIPISLFVLHNVENSDKNTTCIESEIQSKKIKTKAVAHLDTKNSIPLAYHTIFTKLQDFIEKNKLQLEVLTKTAKSCGDRIPLPSVYGANDAFAVDTYTLKEGVMVKKASEKHPDFEKRKIIIANKSGFVGSFIDDGRLGLCGNHKFYITGENLELLLKMLKFKIVTVVAHLTKYGQDFLEKEVFTYIPDIRKLNIADITEAEFYQLLNLTDMEIEQIRAL